MQVFLDTHNIDYKLQSSDAKLETTDIAKEAEGYTVHVTCSNQFFKKFKMYGGYVESDFVLQN